MVQESLLTMMATTGGDANLFESSALMTIANGSTTQSSVEQEEFLRTRRVVAATKRLKNEARVKRQMGRYLPFLNQDATIVNRHRNEVASAVAKAKYRIASMGKEEVEHRDFDPSFIACIRLWRYNRRQKKKAKNTSHKGVGLEKSWIYYGGYLYEPGEQTGWYKTEYMYPLIIITSILVSLMAVLARITVRIMSNGVEGSGATTSVLYPYSTLVFASWDFHITSFERFGALVVLWPLLMAGTVAAVWFLVSKEEVVNEKLGKYGEPVLFALLNNVGPTLVKMLVTMEEWRPATHERVVVMKLYFLRVLNNATYFYRLYTVLWDSWKAMDGLTENPTCSTIEKCPDGLNCCTGTDIGEWHVCTTDQIGMCVPACTENWVGGQLLRTILVTTFLNIAFETVYGFGHVLIFHV